MSTIFSRRSRGEFPFEVEVNPPVVGQAADHGSFAWDRKATKLESDQMFPVFEHKVKMAQPFRRGHSMPKNDKSGFEGV